MTGIRPAKHWFRFASQHALLGTDDAPRRTTLRYLFFALAFLATVFLGISCDKGNGPNQPDVTPVLSELEAPELVSPAQTYLLRLKVADPQGRENVQAVTIAVVRKGEQMPVAVDSLYDDGAHYHPSDGDVVAGDGLYSQRIVWRWSGETEETYLLVFEATDVDGNRSEPLQREVSARKNNPPVILQVEVPSVLPSGFEGTLFLRVQVADSQGVDDVAGVAFDAFQAGYRVFGGDLFNDGSHGDSVPADDWFELGVTAAFAAGRKGDYALRFRALDRLFVASETVERAMTIENAPPQIGAVDLPDTVAKPETGSIAAAIAAVISDPQTLADVKAVGFTSLKPDSTFANNGLPIPMVDNGLPFDPGQIPAPYYGDEVAGDGIYTFTLVVYSDEEAASSGLTPVQKGEYRFTFQAEDWAGQKSELVVKTFVIR